MPPGEKKSCRFGRFSRGAGVIEMGAEVDNVGIAGGSLGTKAMQFL
jgi:hypothetical protein